MAGLSYTEREARRQSLQAVAGLTTPAPAKKIKRIQLVDLINNPESLIPAAPAKRKKKPIPKPQPPAKDQPQDKIGATEMLQPDEKCNELLQKPEKRLKMTANQIAYEALRATGMNHYQTTKALGLSKGYGYDTNGVAKKSYLDAIEKLAPASVKAIKRLSQGQLVGEMTDIKGSDVLGANKMIWDRVAPVEQSAVATATTFVQVTNNFGITPDMVTPVAIELSPSKLIAD